MKFLKNQSGRLICLIAFAFLLFSCGDHQKGNIQNNAAITGNQPNFKQFKTLLPNSSGLTFINTITEDENFNIINYHYFYNGGGVAVGDVNNDGLQDIYFTANQLPDKLFINKGGMKFEDVSDGLPQEIPGSWKTGVTMVDINSDGLLDIYISKSGEGTIEQRRNVLLINQGDLTFQNKAEDFGLDDPAYSSQAAFFDFDKDGDLDMFLLNHEIKDITNYNRQIRESGVDPYAGDKLYRNDGGKFTEIGREAGIKQNPYGFGLGVAIGDLNNDNWPDVYVTNDFLENDYLYLNNHDGTFTESIKKATKHGSNYGMGVDIADVNNDGFQDILVVDMVAKDNYRQKTNMSGMNPERFWQSINFGFHYQYMYNTLQLNRGEEKFSEIGQMAGISNTDWSWSALMADLDNDGFKDILITNGLRKEIRNNDYVKKLQSRLLELESNPSLDKTAIMKELLKKMPSQRIPNYVYKNQGNLRFKDVSSSWGVSKASFSTGATYADLDNDGDLDLVMNNVDDTAHIYENNQNEKENNNFLTIKLLGPSENRDAIGARIVINTEDGAQINEISRSRGFQSSVTALVHFGLGNKQKVKTLTVNWPDGRVSELGPVNSNQVLEINHADSESMENELMASEDYFIDITDELGINFKHQENAYDDFQDQVLLPHKLSNLGPAIAVGDVDGDKLDDFFIGGANGQSGKVFQQTANGKFKEYKGALPSNHSAYEDVDAVFFDADGDDDLDLYVASGSYEFEMSSPLLHDRLYLNNGKGKFSYNPESLPDIKVSTSCVRPHDIDGDGDLDIFVGGRLTQKKYPIPSKSYILENKSGKFFENTSKFSPELGAPGMVTDAEWVDINGNGSKELLIAGEWMPLRVFQLLKGELQEIKPKGLEKSNGWWYSLTPVDIDNDGDMDIVGGNLGMNYKYKASPTTPFKVFGDDFDQNESMDIVLSFAENGTYYPVRGRECSSQQMPFIKEKFPDYKSFGAASLDQILDPKSLENSLELNAYTFASTVFENNGKGNFKMKPLDRKQQLSSINDVLATDLNNDGNPDLIMGGNLYAAEVETPRNDAGYGSILMGKPSGGFENLPSRQAGFFGEGEVRGILRIRVGNSYDAIIIAKNNKELRVFRFVKDEKS